MHNEQFNKNLQRWSLFCPNDVEPLKQIDCNRVFFETTHSEKNLYQEVEGTKEYYHSVEGAEEEARKWFSDLDLQGINVLYVYGVGLGYYYDAAKEWLRDESHFLVFLEDDFEVIHRLFETEKGSSILEDKQVRLFHFTRFDPMEIFWSSITQSFTQFEFALSVLKYYKEKHNDLLPQLRATLSYWFNFNRSMASEYLDFGHHFFGNFYNNIHQLPRAYRANGLFKKFSGIPAIICGAGPSLDKNLDLLEKLEDRALIFAGSTALNAVNSRGFIPHFGLGIDPNPEQLTRLIMNTAYEIPFLYRQRLYYEALELIQGPLLFVNGSGGYRISNWLEEELGIPGEHVDEGFNVVNFSLSLAHAFGCNPIIFVGLDLAYTDQMSYQSGVESHPTHIHKRDFRTKNIREDLLIKDDIYGKPVYTLWKWLTESLWYTQFANTHPDVLFINSTEGGIGMPGIPNRPLSEVIEHLLWNTYDLRSRVHGEIQNCTMPETLTSENIQKSMKKMDKSLLDCDEYSQKISQEIEKNAKDIKEGSDYSADFMTEASRSNLEKMQSEIAYKYILQAFKDFNTPSARLKLQQVNYELLITPSESAEKKAKILAESYNFVCNAALINRILLQSFALKEPEAQQLTKEASKFIYEPAKDEQYFLEDDILTLIDPELGLFYQEQIPSGKILKSYRLHYPDESIKMDQYYLDGKLHGPVSFYSPEGRLLARSWFINGQRQGKTFYYYSTGEIYSIQRFFNGEFEGQQQYFYNDGTPKTILNYHQGKLSGEVILYYPNGANKRSIHFLNGKRDGIEKFWNEAGTLILEAEHRDGKPIGKARTWHPNGQLAQEVVFDENSKSVSIQCWNAEGALVPEKSPDFFDAVTKQTQLFTKSLEDVYAAINRIVPLVSSTESKLQDPIEAKLKDLKSGLENLQTIGQELLQESGLLDDSKLEQIWKTPSGYRALQQQLDEMTKKLSEDLGNIQDTLSEGKKHREEEETENKKEQERKQDQDSEEGKK